MTKLSPLQRAIGLLVIVFLLGGVCWLDTLDLTDDVLGAQQLMLGLQAIEAEEGQELLLSFVTGALAIWLISTAGWPFQSRSCSLTHVVSLPSDRPLYQRLCTYRI